MNNQNESALTIPYVKVGDYYFPNLSLPPDAGDIGFWGRRRKEFLREHRPVTSTSWCCPASCSSILPCSIRKLLNDWKVSFKP